MTPLDAHVHMIKMQMPLLYLTLLLPGQFVEYFPKMLAQYSIDLLLAPLWDENNMILAIPSRVI